MLSELKADLTNQTASLPNTLRKAKVVAQQLGLAEMRDWIRWELEGYPSTVSLPEYRRFKPTNIGTFSGPFQSMARNVVLPTYSLPDSIRDFAENADMHAGVGELEAMLVTDSDSLARRWPQEAVMLARDSVEMTGGMVLVDAHSPIPKHVIAGVVDNIKNKLLDFVLDLESSEGIVTSDDEELRTNTARGLFQINIYGGTNTVAAGDNFTQETQTVSAGDVESVLNLLKQSGLPNDEAIVLKKALKAEPEAAPGKLGPKVSKWLSQAVTKAASGVWKIGVEVAPRVIMKALESYYGW